MSPNFRPETTFSKVTGGRVRTADLQTRRLALNPLLHRGTHYGILIQVNPNEINQISQNMTSDCHFTKIYVIDLTKNNLFKDEN